MNRWIQLLFGFALSFVGLFFAFKNLSPSSILKSFQALNYFWILASVFALFLSALVRSLRWKLLLISIKPVELKNLFASTMIGYFGNSALPFKMGEILRGYYISTLKNIKTSTVLGSIVLERTCDLLGLIMTFSVVSIFYSFDLEIKLSLLPLIFLLSLTTILIVYLFFKKNTFFNKILNLSKRKSESFFRITNMLRSFGRGFSSISNFKVLFSILMYTLLLWLLFFLTTYFVIKAFGFDLSLVEVGVILLLTSIAMSIPAAPGAIGTHHFAAYYVMTNMFLFSDIESQSFAIVLHAVSYIPLALCGALYFFSSSLKIFDVLNKEIVDDKV